MQIGWLQIDYIHGFPYDLLMTSVTFWQVFAAVLGANLLTVAFVWAGVQVGRRERAAEPLGVYIWGFVLPLVMCAGALYIAFGGQ